MSSSPNFDINSLLGFTDSSVDMGRPTADVLHEKKAQEQQDLQELMDDNSWMEHGHPMGDEVGGEALADLGLSGLLRFGGGGQFGGVLKDSVDVDPTGKDPLSFMSDFLADLTDNAALRAQWGFDEAELRRLSEGLTSAKEIADELNYIREADATDAPQLIDTFANELKERLEANGVVYFPVMSDAGRYSRIVRVDQEHGFSVIEVDETQSPYLSDARPEILQGSKVEQSLIKHTTIDPLTGRTVETIKAQQFISYEAKNKDRLGDKGFFKALVTGSVMPVGDMKDLVYESLPKYVDGKRLKASDKESAFYRKTYRYFDKDDKDSSFQSVSALLYYMSLDPFFGSDNDCEKAVQRYKKMKFLLQSQLFVAYVRKIDEKGDWNKVSPDERIFLNDLLTNLTRSAEKLMRSNTVTKEQLDPFFATCLHIKSVLSQPVLVEGIETEDDAEVLARAEAMDPNVHFARSGAVGSIAVPGLDAPMVFDGGMVDEDAEDQTVAAKPAEKIITDLTNFDFTVELTEDAADKAQQIEYLRANLEHLKGIYQELKANPRLSFRSRGGYFDQDASFAERRAVYHQYLQTLSNAVALLPAPEKGDHGFWGTLTADQQKECYALMEEYSLLVQSFGTLERANKPRFVSEPSSGHSPESTLMMLTLQAIQLKLAAQHPDFGVKEGEFSYLPYLLEMRSINFVVGNAALRKQIHSLMLYFDQDWNVEELTRELSKNDLINDARRPFSFCNEEGREVTGWQVKLSVKQKEKGADQLFFERMLEVPGVKAGVRQVMMDKNAELDRQHDDAMDRYRQDMEQYQREKADYEQRIRQKVQEVSGIENRHDPRIQRIKDGLDARSIGDFERLGELNHRLSNARAWDFTDYIRTERDEILERLQSIPNAVQIADRLYAANQAKQDEIRGPRGELATLRVNLSGLVEPDMPTHPGHFPLDSVVDQVACLLFDEEGRGLIPEDMNAIVQSVLRGQYLLSHGNPDFDMDNQGIRFRFNGTWKPLPLDAQNKREPIQMRIEKTELDGSGAERIDTLTSSDCPKSRAQYLRAVPAFDGDWRSEDSLRDLLSEETRRSLTQNQAIVSHDQHFNLDVGKTRELRMLALDPYDTVSRTIGFLGRNMVLVANPAIREYVRVLLFRPERIHSQLRDNPKLTKKIDKFIKKAVAHYQELKDVDTCLAMIKLGEQFRLAAVEINGDDAGFSDYRSIVLNELIPSCRDDESAKLKAYRTLVQLHAYDKAHDEITPSQMTAIKRDILAMRVSRQLQTSAAPIGQQDEAMEKAVLLRYQQLLQDEVPSIDLTYALKTAVSDADLDDDSLWDSDDQIQYACGRYSININTGLVSIDGKPIVHTPDWITDNEKLRRVYPYSFDSSTCTQDAEWRYTLHKGDPVKEVSVVSYDRGDTIEIERLIDGQKYRHMPTPAGLIHHMPTLFNEESIFWVNSRGEILVYNDGEKAFRIHLNDGRGYQREIGRIVRLEDNAEFVPFDEIESGQQLMQGGPDLTAELLFQPLAVFEKDSRFIECWNIQDGRKLSVNFKRLGLSFEVRHDELRQLADDWEFRGIIAQFAQMQQQVEDAGDEEQKRRAEIACARMALEMRDHLPVHCQNFPGFSLTMPVLVQSISEQLPYITLLNSSGERKILVPKVESERFRLGEEPTEWYEYDVVKVKSNGITSYDLSSSAVEQQLFQMMMWARRKDFVKVKRIADKLNPLGSMTEKESRLLMAAIGVLAGYNHPEANALVLKMLLIKEVNALKYPKVAAMEEDHVEAAPDNIFEQFADELLYIGAYERYREGSGNTSSFRLTDEEERKFVEILYTKIKDKVKKVKQQDRDAVHANGFFERILKKGERWFKGTLLPSLVVGFLEQRIGDRYEYLSTQKGKLGMKKVTFISVPNIEKMQNEPPKPVSGKDELWNPVKAMLEEDGKRLPIPTAGEIKDCLETLVKDKNFWKENYLLLYHVARSGTPEQKDNLKRALDLTTHLNSSEHRLIRWVLAKPGRYPTIEKMNGIVEKWKVEGPRELQEAEDDLSLKQDTLHAATEDRDVKQQTVDDLQNEEFQILDWGSLKGLKDRRKRTEKEQARAQKRIDADRYESGYWGDQERQQDRQRVADSVREIREIEAKIGRYDSLQPRLKAARAELKAAEKVFREASKEANKAAKRHTKAEAYIEKMENKLKSEVTSVLPSKFWVIIQNVVKPIFALIPKAWKLFWKGNKFLHKHSYKVRDIFSSGQVSKPRAAMDVDRGFLKQTDTAFNNYFKQLEETYFTVDVSHDDADHDWNAADGDDPLVRAKLASEKAALEEYRSEVRKPREHAALKRGQQLEDLLVELEEKEQTLSVSLVQQKEVLLWQLNRAINADEQAALVMSLNRSGQKGELTWDDLRALTLDGSWESFQEKTGLDETNAKELMRGVADYLVKATRLNQVRTVIGKVKKAQSETSERKLSIYCTNILEALRLERHYLSEDGFLSKKDMGRLWFEHANGYMYRKQQIETLDQTAAMDDPEILMEAPTGFGKSKNYVPTRDHEMAGEHLVLNVHPRTIERINAEDILSQMRDSFGGKADRFHFQRSSEFTVHTLKMLYEELQVNFEEGRPINFSAETLQALELHFLMTLYDYKQKVKGGHFKDADKIQAREEIAYFIMILRAISVYGWATIDESHVNLNPFTNKLIYTIGESSTLETYQVDILEEMMQLMVEDYVISGLAKVADNKQAKVTADQYQTIAQRMAEHFAPKYGISDEQMPEYTQFVLGQLDDVPSWIAKHKHAKQIALVKGMLSLILKSAMEGYVDENYGLSILHFDKGKEYAIAYASSNTPKENETSPSQFKNPHETMIKTYLTYLHKGLREEQVVKMIKKMQAEQQLEAQTTGSLSNTKANEAFREIAGGSMSLQELTEDHMRDLFPTFQHNKDAIFYYVRNVVVPQLRLYEKTLVSTPQNLRSMFASSLSMSATPQDAATHGPDTVMVPMKGTQGQVTHLFLKKVDHESKIHRSSGSDPHEVLESAIDTVLENGHLKCIIDAGGLLRGISNEHVAERLRNKIREEGSGIEAIQYFDVKEEKFVVMEVGTGTLSDPSVVKTDPAKMITIFDQPRCFGSDTVQDEMASALLLTKNSKSSDSSSDTTKNNAGQGAGRMRQWHLDQGMEVMMTPEDYTSVFGDREANIGDLLTQWIGSLSKQEAKENYQALLQQMDNELRTPAMHRMLGVKTGDRHKDQKDTIRDEKPDVDKALRLFGKFESLLVTDDSTDPWVLYAEMPKDKDPEDCLDVHLKRTKARASKMGGFSRSQRSILKKRLRRYSKKWTPPKAGEADERVKLPAKVKSSKVDTGTQVEVQVQAEMQVEAHEEEMRWEDLITRTPSRWSDKINLFNPGWEKPKRKMVFFNRIANKLSKLEPTNPTLKLLFRVGLVVAGTGLAATAAAVAGVAWPIVVGVGSALLVAGLAYVAYKAFAGRNVQYVPNCAYKMRDVMGIQLPRKYKRGARFFSPNLTVSNNFYAQHTPSWRQPEQKPFTQEQKPVFNVLVIQDEDKKGNAKLQMMLIDQNDSVYFRRRLQDDYETTTPEEAGKRKRKIAVYDVTNGTIAVQGKNAFADKELKQNSEFIELLAQAKAVNREIRYTDEEKLALGARAQRVGGTFMTRFVEDHILEEDPTRKILFPKSDFYHALQTA